MAHEKRRLSAFVPLILLIASFSGCFVPDEPQEALPWLPEENAVAFREPVLAFECRVGRAEDVEPVEGVTGVSCFEPTIASDPQGRLFVTEAAGDALVRSLDGGRSFERVGVPPFPPGAPADVVPLDATVQTDLQGRLYYSALLFPGEGVEGFHVARSSDAGESWGINAYVSADPTRFGGGASADRQWLAFAPDGTVYLSYMQTTRGVWVARSHDGGVSFDTFVRVAPASLAEASKAVAGRIVVDEQGRLLLPYFLRMERGALEGGILRVATSQDGGLTWSATTVEEKREGWPIGVFMPMLAPMPDGGASIAWMNATGSLRVAVSEDPARHWRVLPSWTPPEAAVSASPWIAAESSGRLLVLSYVAPAFGSPTTLLLSSSKPDAQPAYSVVAGALPVAAPKRPANTDFAHFTQLPDGRLAITWTDAATGVYVRVQNSSDRALS